MDVVLVGRRSREFDWHASRQLSGKGLQAFPAANGAGPAAMRAAWRTDCKGWATQQDTGQGRGITIYSDGAPGLQLACRESIARLYLAAIQSGLKPARALSGRAMRE